VQALLNRPAEESSRRSIEGIKDACDISHLRSFVGVEIAVNQEAWFFVQISSSDASLEGQVTVVTFETAVQFS
jgi:hypothetical protein